MTIDLDAIRARADAATRAPWISDGAEIFTADRAEWIGECLRVDDDTAKAQGERDAEFIAAARTDVVLLLNEIDLLHGDGHLERQVPQMVEINQGLVRERDGLRADLDRVTGELAKAKAATQKLTVDLIAHSPRLETPYTNSPLSPWDRISAHLNQLREAVGLRNTLESSR